MKRRRLDRPQGEDQGRPARHRPAARRGQHLVEAAADLRCRATPAEIKNPRILRRWHTLCAAATGDGLPCSGRHLSAATGQRRPLGIAEAVLSAREQAHGVLARPPRRRKALRGIVLQGKRGRGVRTAAARGVLPEAHSDVAWQACRCCHANRRWRRRHHRGDFSGCRQCLSARRAAHQQCRHGTAKKSARDYCLHLLSTTLTEHR